MRSSFGGFLLLAAVALAAAGCSSSISEGSLRGVTVVMPAPAGEGERCGRCGGFGKTCPECTGRGSCPECEGTGKGAATTRSRILVQNCPACGGAGGRIVKIEPPREEKGPDVVAESVGNAVKASAEELAKGRALPRPADIHRSVKAGAKALVPAIIALALSRVRGGGRKPDEAVPAEVFEPCAPCGGSGRLSESVQYTESKPCPRCRGKRLCAVCAGQGTGEAACIICRGSGSVLTRETGFLGVTLAEGDGGVEVLEVHAAARDKGLLPEDVILRIEDVPVAAPMAAFGEIRSRFAGDSIRLRVRRAGATIEMRVPLGRYP